MHVTKKQLQAVSAAASTDATPFNLNGVHFDGSLIVATDGHRLHLIDDLGAMGGKFTISLEDIKRLIQAMGPNSLAEIQYKGVGERVIFALVEGSRFEFEPLEGEFCNYRQVIPKADRSVAGVVSVNAKYLRAACDAAIKTGDYTGRAPNVRLELGEYLAPIKITSGELQTIVMPMHDARDAKAKAERDAAGEVAA